MPLLYLYVSLFWVKRGLVLQRPGNFIISRLLDNTIFASCLAVFSHSGLTQSQSDLTYFILIVSDPSDSEFMTTTKTRKGADLFYEKTRFTFLCKEPAKFVQNSVPFKIEVHSM